VKQLAQRIFRETLAAIDIPATLARTLDRSGSRIRVSNAVFDLRDFREIVVVAFGKASFAMADGLAQILAPDFSPQGILVTPAESPRKLPGFTHFIGGHPIPTEHCPFVWLQTGPQRKPGSHTYASALSLELALIRTL
jgi:glycerate-2-kinase